MKIRHITHHYLTNVLLLVGVFIGALALHGAWYGDATSHAQSGIWGRI